MERGDTAYVVDSSLDALISVDLATGNRVVVSDSGTGVGPNFSNPRSLILNGAGDTAYVVDATLDALISVDLATGNRVVVSDSGTGVGPNFSAPLSVILNGAGDTAYVVDTTLDALISVDLATGNRVVVSDSGTGVGPNFSNPLSLILNGAGDTAYVVDGTLDALISVDLATGNRVVVSDSGTGVGPNFSNPTSLILNGAGDTAYVVDSLLDALISVDLATGDRSYESGAIGAANGIAPGSGGGGAGDPTITIVDAVANEADGTVDVTLYADEAAGGSYSVDVGATGGTATAGDFGVIPAAQFTGTDPGEIVTVTIPIPDDLAVEADEIIQLALSNAQATGGSGVDTSGFTLADTAEVTLLDDDAAAVTIDPVGAVDEDAGTVTVTLRLDQPVDGGFDVDVALVDGSAEGGGTDFADPAAGVTVTFAGAAADETRDVVIPITDDALFEGSENFFVGLTNLSMNGAAPSGSVNIIDAAEVTIIDDGNNDHPTADLSVTQQGTEGGTDIVYTVTLGKVNNTGEAITFDLADAGTGSALSDGDYTAIPAGAQIAIEDGLSTGSFSVHVADDDLLEADTETVAATISNPSNGDVSIGTATATATITDDDTATADLSVTTQGVEGGADLVFTVTLDKVNDTGSAITFDLAASGGSATGGGVDYGAFGQISVADGASTGSLTVSVTDDGDLETLVETVEATISNPSNGDVTIGTATATADITDNETATADLSVTTQGDENGPTDIEFTVTLDKVNDTGGPITFELADLGTGTATAGSDYGALPSTITVADGASTGTAMVSVTDDALLEGAETVEAQIINPSDPRVSIGTGTATATITDDDDAAVTIGDVTVNEETGFATVALTLDNAVEGGFTVPVNFAPGATNGATGNVDFNATSRTAVFAGTAGEVQSITISIADDAIVEADETIAVSLGAASQGLVNTSDTATGTITNTDEAAVSIDDVVVTEGTGAATDVTLTLGVDHPVEGGFAVKVTPAFGSSTPTEGADFPGGLPAGQWVEFSGTDGESREVTFQVEGDARVELDETIDFALEEVVTATPFASLSGDTFDFGAAHGLSDGDEVIYAANGGAEPGSLVDGGRYYVVNAAGATLQLAATPGGAAIGTGPGIATPTSESLLTGSALGVDAGEVDHSDTATATILDDDAAAVTISTDATGALAEGDTVTVTLTLDHAVECGFSVQPVIGTATVGDGMPEATDHSSALPVLTFAGTAGETETFTIDITEDTIVEGNETLVVSLQHSAFRMVLTDATGDFVVGEEIVDSDDPTISGKVVAWDSGTGKLEYTPVSGNFSSSTGQFEGQISTVTATATNPSTDLDPSAPKPAVDLTATETVTIPANDTASVSITNVVSSTEEGVMTFDVVLTGDTGSPADDDIVVEGGFHVDVGRVLEKGGTVEDVDGNPIDATLPNSFSGAQEAGQDNGDALAELGDVGGFRQTLDFAGTHGESFTVTVPLNDDALLEQDESFTVALNNLVLHEATPQWSGASNGPVSLPTAPTELIIENTDTATVRVRADPANSLIAESGSAGTTAKFIVELSEVNKTGSAITVNYSLAGTAIEGLDFETLPGQVEIANDERTAEIEVEVIDDSVFDSAAQETVIVTLDSTDNGKVTPDSTHKQAGIGILDNEPVVIDLDGDGVEFAGQPVKFDVDDDGTAEFMAWAGKDDGILVYDGNENDDVDQREEIVFTEHAEEAETDLEAIREAFDSDGDGELTVNDEEWAKFKIWQDADSDGQVDAGELSTLDELGVASIGLFNDGNADEPTSGVFVHGESELTYEDGSTAAVADVSLRSVDGLTAEDVREILSESEQLDFGDGEAGGLANGEESAAVEAAEPPPPQPGPGNVQPGSGPEGAGAELAAAAAALPEPIETPPAVTG